MDFIVLSRTPFARRARLLLGTICCVVGMPIWAADVTANFSQDSAGIGEPIRFQIRIDGGRPDGVPRDLRADGLEITYNGASQSNQLSFGTGGIKSISTVILNYTVVPQKAGTFTIPGVNLSVDGKALQTRPASLRVEQGQGGGSNANGGGQSAPLSDKWSFAEIVVPKTTAYVGESIPAEFRLYVDTRVTWQPESAPEIEAEGFTKAKMPEPRQERARRDGKDYDVIVFKTVITPTKAGKVRLGPSNIVFAAQVPRARPKRQRSPFDMFGDDFFNDPSFGGLGAWERRKATADVVELNVKPLPAIGVPESFSGAVGRFELTATGSPKEVKIGDPLTMSVTVEGRGNFDRVNAPTLKDAAGWRSYPPSNNFVPEDDVSFRGSKNFQFAVIPEARKTAMPQFEFTYFDPDAEKYVTLQTEAAPLKVTGAVAPPPATPARGQGPEPAKVTEPAPTPEAPALTDILANRYDLGASGSFTPIYESRNFWLVQIVPGALLLGMLLRRLFSSNDSKARLAALKRERSAQLSRLRSEEARVPFLDAATRAIQLDTALVTGQEPSTVDAATACRSRQIDLETAAAIDAIFQSRAEALYAGAAHDGGRIAPAERERFLAAVSQFDRSHGLN